MNIQASLNGTVYADQTGKVNIQFGNLTVTPQFVTSTLGPQQLLGQYLTPQAAAAAAKALNNGVNNAATALGNAYNSAVAKYRRCSVVWARLLEPSELLSKGSIANRLHKPLPLSTTWTPPPRLP